MKIVGVKAAILDLSKTLIADDGQPVPGVEAMMAELRHAGLKLVFASNEGGGEFRAARAGFSPDLHLTWSKVRENKGSPRWVDMACEELGVQRREVVWLGDSKLDMRSAVNAHIPYFQAAWADPNYPYGLHMTTPRLFSLVVRECFMKQVPWFASFDGKDKNDLQVRTLSMTDSWGGGSKDLMDRLVDLLKHRRDRLTQPVRFGEFVTYHLMGSIATSGVSAKADVWTIYPGSKGGINASLEPFAAQAARLFKDKFYADLLHRHTEAEDSGTTRRDGGKVSIGNQISTMRVNPQYRDQIVGKHVFVVDDFETEGHSLECARLLLYQAGARAVTGIAVSRYMMSGHGYQRHVWSYTGDPDAWDPFQPFTFDANDFDGSLVNPTRSSAAQSFRESYERVYQSTP